MDEERILTGRFRDLSERAERCCCRTTSEFLTPAEQALLTSLHLPGASLSGGFDNAERKIAVFTGEWCGEEEETPIVCLRISPRSQKYADKLTHRDILGSVLALGVRRDVTGDIILHENTAYLMCLRTISDFIREELKKVRHTDVDVDIADAPPAEAVALPEKTRIVISSERLDAIVAAAFKLSRSETQTLFEAEKIALGGKIVTSFTGAPKPGAIISVRGFGRLIYEGLTGETKKGRLSAEVRICR